jgi:hypothetical protein
VIPADQKTIVVGIDAERHSTVINADQHVQQLLRSRPTRTS